MISTPRVLACGLGLTLAAFSCTPPCDPVSSHLSSLCHRADAGAIAPDASFVLEGTSYVFSSVCEVGIDGGSIELQVTGSPGCGTGGAAAARAAPAPVKCTIPPLAAGTYTVNSQPEVSFTIPGDAGVPPCF